MVTSLSAEHAAARHLYEDLYCARGDMENRILRNNSSHQHPGLRANQIRLYFSSFAYVLLCALRYLGLKDTELARTQCGTIRTRLLKIGAQVRLSIRRICISLLCELPRRARLRAGITGDPGRHCLQRRSLSFHSIPIWMRQSDRRRARKAPTGAFCTVPIHCVHHARIIRSMCKIRCVWVPTKARIAILHQRLAIQLPSPGFEARIETSGERCGLGWLGAWENALGGTVSVDESYFGGRRVRGKRGRGAGGKTIIFGILERHGKSYTEIVPNAAKKPLQIGIRGRVVIVR